MSTVRFTEQMKGFVDFAEEDFARGYESGRRHGTSLMFRLTIEIPDMDRFVADPDRAAIASGWVGCEELGGRLQVQRGTFNLFVEGERPGEKRMLYRLHFADGVGHRLTLSGCKVIHDDPGIDLWPDTSTLYTKVLRGHVGPEEEAKAELVASGILRIRKLDFIRQLTTFRGSGRTKMAGLRGLARFNMLFAGELRKVYMSPRKFTRRRA